MHLNAGRFLDNGACGYVLKPPCLRPCRHVPHSERCVCCHCRLLALTRAVETSGGGVGATRERSPIHLLHSPLSVSSSCSSGYTSATSTDSSSVSAVARPSSPPVDLQSGGTSSTSAPASVAPTNAGETSGNSSSISQEMKRNRACGCFYNPFSKASLPLLGIEPLTLEVQVIAGRHLFRRGLSLL